MKEITKKLIEFRNERNWQSFHTPEKIAVAAMIEAGELSELFQWGQTPNPERVSEEIADTAIYLLYLCEKYGFDLKDIIDDKIKKNSDKYKSGVSSSEYGWEVTK